MTITLRSSLSTSVRMFSLRDSSMDKDRAFRFLGLFKIILLKEEKECCYTFTTTLLSSIFSTVSGFQFLLSFLMQ